MINWLRKFITNVAKVLKPLTDLTAKSKSDVVKWGPEQQNAWDEVKVILTTVLLLVVCKTLIRNMQ
jgi:hypothetical protein